MVIVCFEQSFLVFHVHSMSIKFLLVQNDAVS